MGRHFLWYSTTRGGLLNSINIIVEADSTALSAKEDVK